MARRTKLTRPLIDELAEAIREGATRRQACASLGISYKALKEWLREGRKATRGLKADLAEAVEEADELHLWDVRKEIRAIGEGRQLGDWRALAWLHGHRQAHALDRLKGQRLKTENRRLEAEVEHRELVNDALRFQRDHKDKPGDFTREALELQKIEATDDEIARYYHVPSYQEDVAATEAEKKPDDDRPQLGQAPTEDEIV